MDSQNSGSSLGGSRSTRSRSVPHSDEVLCYHDEVAPLRVVRAEGPTQGRRFYGCSHYPRTCGFMKWADVCEDVRELQHMLFVKDGVINELEAQNYMLREKLRKIRIKRADLMDSVEEMGIAQTETMWEMKNMVTEKKMVLFALLVVAAVLFFK